MRDKNKTSLVKVAFYFVIFIFAINLPIISKSAPVLFIKSIPYYTVLPFQMAWGSISGGATYFIRSVSTLRNVQKYNDLLQTKIDTLKASMVSYEAIANENTSLREMLEFRNKNPYALSLIPAEVIVRSPDNWFDSIEIDKGSNDGVKLNKAVVNSSGLIGKVIGVSAKHSKVLLLTDADSSVSVIIERTGDMGVAVGAGSGGTYIKLICSRVLRHQILVIFQKSDGYI